MLGTRVHGFVFLLLLLILATGTGAAAFYQVSFQGMDVEPSAITVGDDIDVRSNLANIAEQPYTDIKVTATLVRQSDRTRMVHKVLEDDLDLGPRELAGIDTAVQVPDYVPSGEYELILQAYTPVGIPMTFISQDINVTNPQTVKSVRFGRQGVYLEAPTVVVGDNIVTRYSLPSFGSQGENVLPGTTFNISFSLTNDGETAVDPAATIDIVPTYSTQSDPLTTLEEDLGTLEPGETREYDIPASLDTAGTYVVDVTVRDGDTVLGENEVRLVIAGGSGSIVDVKNAQDTYQQGENVAVNTTIVGPADGSTRVEDAFLRLELLKDGETVTDERHSIAELPLNPEDISFTTATPEELDRYTLRLTLGKDDRVFDTFEAEYQPIEVERRLTASGQVQEAGQCFDNGVCTQEEYEIGGCYDCIGVNSPPSGEDEESQSDGGLPQGIIVIGLLLAGIIGGAIIFREVR